MRSLVELLGLGVGVSPPLASPPSPLLARVKLRPWSSYGLAYVIGGSGCAPWPRPPLAVLDLWHELCQAPLPPEHLFYLFAWGQEYPPAMNTPFDKAEGDFPEKDPFASSIEVKTLLRYG